MDVRARDLQDGDLTSTNSVVVGAAVSEAGWTRLTLERPGGRQVAVSFHEDDILVVDRAGDRL